MRNRRSPTLVFDNEGDYTEESMERLLSGLAFGGDRARPYDGQPWTSQGARGQTAVEGLTMRDIGDCIARAAAVLGVEVPVQVITGSMIEIEKMMAIFPNVSDGPMRIPMLVIGGTGDPPDGAS